MTGPGLRILSIGPGASIQDTGRPGLQRFGVTGGGAMDPVALAEGAALLANPPDAAALEMAMTGGRFQATGAVAVATSGAEMALSVNGTAMPWRAVLHLDAGDVLDIGAARGGVYGYLHLPGGIDAPTVLGSRATHVRAGLGTTPAAGMVLRPLAPSRAVPARRLPAPGHFGRTRIRFLWGPQAALFPDEALADFVSAPFRVGRHRDRMGIRLEPAAGPLPAGAGLRVLSDAVCRGDIQIGGDGMPTVLMADHQPTGGYPRIGTVIGADLPALAQAPTGAEIALEPTDIDTAVAARARLAAETEALPRRLSPLVRDPADMPDLLAYNLIDGVTNGDADDLD